MSTNRDRYQAHTYSSSRDRRRDEHAAAQDYSDGDKFGVMSDRADRRDARDARLADLDASRAMRSALEAAVRRGGVVMTNTRTHRALESKGWVEGVQITPAGRQAIEIK